ncbi:MAG: hypothetical protein FWC21_02550 [Treponema sp.]|nr:hypothetical protein [Treponema sp.]
MRNLNEILINIKTNKRAVLFIIIGVIAGSVLTGFFVYRSGPASIRTLDSRYDSQYRRATETIGKLESELDKQRNINNQLRNYNTRARELALGLTESTERNVRNLQDAIALIAEIRGKLKVLEDFYANSDSGNGTN